MFAAHYLRKFIFAAGALISLLCLVGVFWGVRAAVAHALYYGARYGNPDVASRDPLQADAVCSRSHRLYPFNYYFCEWIAGDSYDYRFEGGVSAAEGRINVARQWCDAGLALNPWKRKLNMIKALLLAEDSPVAGMMFWERHLDWDFWDPYNHSVYITLQLKAGDFDSALVSLDWVKGSMYYADARRQIMESWQTEVFGASGR